MKMKRAGTRIVMMVLAATLLFGLSACQKKQIAVAPAATDAGGTIGAADPTAGRQRIGEQDLGAGAGRAADADRVGAAPDWVAFENEDIFFAYDSSALTEEAQEVLRRKAAFLNANAQLRVTVEGHCDERGTNEYNLALGEARAKSAKAFLADLGISAARIATISYGEERPLVEGTSEEAYAKNRRAHFVIER
jgi:peptidoglycan-associated lipoprotein